MAITPVNLSQLVSNPNASTQAPTPIPATGFWADVGNAAKNVMNFEVATMLPGLNPTSIPQTVNTVTQGYQSAVDAETASITGQENPLRAGVDVASGLATVATSPFASLTKPLSDTISNPPQGSLMDKITSNPSYQKFAMSDTGQNVAKGAETVGGLANVAGTVAAGADMSENMNAQSGAPVANNVWDKAYNTPTSLDTATAARETVAQTGVKSMQNITDTVGDYKNDLGTSFKQGAVNIEKTNPNLKLELTPDQIDALNTLKTNKSFALPDYLKNQNIVPSNAYDIANGKVTITPTQAQDLITQLNRSTFMEKAGGLGVDQSKIGLTNEIKNAANSTFGDQWRQIYSGYSQGMNAIDKMSDIVDLSKDITSTDINKNINSILNLSKTPEGKIVLKNSIAEFYKTSGYDLTDPVQSIQKIMDAQSALDDAQAVAKKSAVEQEKGGFGKRFIAGATNPSRLGSMAVRIAGMATIGYLLRKEITDALKAAGL